MNVHMYVYTSVSELMCVYVCGVSIHDVSQGSRGSQD